MTAADPEDQPQRDRARTRARIMQAAKVAFSKVGYAKANVRDIAAEAGITAALIVRYFGSKEQLFEEAVGEAFDLRHALSGTPRTDLGKVIAATLFSKQQDVDLTAMMLLAATDPSIAARTRRLAHKRMLEPMVELIGGPGAERRAALILSVVTGIWFYRFKLPLKPLAARVDDDVVREVAEIVQRLVDSPR